MKFQPLRIGIFAIYNINEESNKNECFKNHLFIGVSPISLKHSQGGKIVSNQYVMKTMISQTYLTQISEINTRRCRI